MLASFAFGALFWGFENKLRGTGWLLVGLIAAFLVVFWAWIYLTVKLGSPEWLRGGRNNERLTEGDR